MKKILLLFLLVMPAKYLLAQTDTTIYQVQGLSLDSNTVGKPSLTIMIGLNFSQGKISGDYFANGYRPKLHVDYKGKIPKCPLTVSMGVRNNSLSLKLQNLTEETVQRIMNGDNQLSIVFDEDVFFKYRPDPQGHPNAYLYGRVLKDSLNKAMSTQINFPADAQTHFLTAVNTMYYYKNEMDFGVQPGSDTSSLALVLNFNYQNLYNTSSLFSCNGNTKGHTLVYYSISTRLSTDRKDSLNHIDIYPLVIQGSNYAGQSIFKEWALKVGHESSEDFSYRRVVVDGSVSMILPNLVDLASASSTRLRLKPVIDLGIKGYYNYSTNIAAYSSGQAYLNAYYYIPVYDHYAFILNDKTFYDFSEQANPQHQFASNYSLAIGTELPKTGFEVMLKYQDGRSEFNQKQTQAVVIGLLMNMLSK
jgi:hypothetical protein